MRPLVLAAVLGCAPASRPPVPEAAAQVEAVGARLVANAARIQYLRGVRDLAVYAERVR